MKRILSLFFVLLTVCLISNAQMVQPEQARTVAQNFYSERISATTEDDDFQFAQQPIIISDNGLPVIYVFETTDRPGFIMISADYSVYPVLGYSFESYFNEPSVPPVFTDMIADFSTQITMARTLKQDPSAAATEDWEYYANPMFNKSDKKVRAQLPLLQTRWDQGCYYNALCPEDINGPCGFVYAGCVATAMAQVMKFHNWPHSGEGSNTYSTSNGYGTLSVDFSQQTYAWTVMENHLFDHNLEVAKLIYHCGVAVDMDYSPDGSGAQTSTSADAFKNYFKYADYVSHLEKDYFSEDSWAEMLCIELLSHRPVMYRGYGSGGGHAFVCDGFQGTNNNHFHFDFGWSGYSNGYYYLSSLNGFTSDQAGIFGVEPKYIGTSYCEDYVLLTDPQGSISDGSNDERYANNSSCKWLIQPDNAGAIALTFSELETEPGFDRVLIYEGTSENDWLIADISGFDLPTNPIVVSGGSMFLWFITDELNAAPGWEASYTTWFTDVQDYSQGEITLSPNPAVDILYVQLAPELNEPLFVIISDLSGRKVSELNITPQNGYFSVDVSALAKGVYTIEAFDGNESIAKEKMVINN